MVKLFKNYIHELFNQIFHVFLFLERESNTFSPVATILAMSLRFYGIIIVLEVFPKEPKVSKYDSESRILPDSSP